MIDPEAPKFQWGQRVRAMDDLFNDGSFPEQPAEALLVAAGDPGEVVQIGTHVESKSYVYLVEFAPNRVIGCLEHEISPF